MRVDDDEIFGPVLSVVRVPTLDEALTLVNDNPYGNGTALFTRGDGGMARRFERAVQVGMVGINVPIPVPVASHSFGGWKASIFGDSSIYGPDGVRFYTRPRPSRLGGPTRGRAPWSCISRRIVDCSHGKIVVNLPGKCGEIAIR